MADETKRRTILMDTSMILEVEESVIATLNKSAWVFVTDIVLQELDGHKNNANPVVAYKARAFFRRLEKQNQEALMVLPHHTMVLEKRDTVHQMHLGETPLYVMVRKPYKSTDSNDSKIIEIARDYGMSLVTFDMAQRVRAMSEGVLIERSELPKNENTTLRASMQTFLNVSIALLFFGFFANIVHTLLQPLKTMDIAQTVEIGLVFGAGICGVFFVKHLFFDRIRKEGFERRRMEKTTDWHTNPCDNLLIGNTFYSSIHD